MTAATSAPPTLRDAAATTAAAFHDGVLFRYALPDPEQRARRLPWLFASTLRFCAREGRLHVADGASLVAGWLPGERLALSPYELISTGLVLAPFRLGIGPTRRIEAQERPTERVLVSSLTPGTAYLWVLGVRPDRQGEGLGGRLLERVLDTMHALGYRRCLLRTDDPPNVGFYERHAFEVVHELTELPTGLPSWIMAAWTDPAERPRSPAGS